MFTPKYLNEKVWKKRTSINILVLKIIFSEEVKKIRLLDISSNEGDRNKMEDQLLSWYGHV